MKGETSTTGAMLDGPVHGRKGAKERLAERMAMLLEITQAATSSLELGQILKIAVEKVGRVLPMDRCSIVLVDGSGEAALSATVMATFERPDLQPLTIDLARYPRMRWMTR
jgi:two-component system, sensor histidine kinase ChiS